MMRRRSMAAAVLTTIAAPLLAQTRKPSNDSKLIGLSLPLTGVQSEVGRDLERGFELAFKSQPSELQLLILDDGGDAQRTSTNVQSLVSNPNVIAMSAIVGTPHAQAAIPIATKGGLPIVGIRSGAKALRDGRSGVYHLRSSYEEELDILARTCAGMLMKNMAIIYSDDSFGQGAKEHLVEALKNNNINVLTPVPAKRDGSNLEQVTKQIADGVKQQSTPTGIAILMITKPMSDAAKELRDKHKIILPIMAMSFTATKSVASEPIPHLTGLGLVSAFPVPATSISNISQQYRRNCELYGTPELRGSLTAYEGYFYAMTILKTGAKSRNEINQAMSIGIRIRDHVIKPDQHKVCFRYLEVVMKTREGMLRS